MAHRPQLDRDPGPLPGLVDRYAEYGLYCLVTGTVLCLLALFTNPVPDPSFPVPDPSFPWFLSRPRSALR